METHRRYPSPTFQGLFQNREQKELEAVDECRKHCLVDTARQHAHVKTHSDTMHKACLSPCQTDPRMVREGGHTTLPSSWIKRQLLSTRSGRDWPCSNGRPPIREYFSSTKCSLRVIKIYSDVPLYAKNYFFVLKINFLLMMVIDNN